MTLTPENKADACADAILTLVKLLADKGIVQPAEVVATLRAAAAVRFAEGEAGRAMGVTGLAEYIERASAAAASPSQSD